MGLKRRTFLQQAGLALAALGISETVLSLLGDKSLAVPLLDRYFQALAQSGGRKLALLVGINQYPRSTALGGCITDVELQRELLIHRFGFNASDILTLTDSQATRETIETAFINHLSEQAKAGDVVVFHFSGYGSRVKMSQEAQTDNPVLIQNSLVPVDGILPTRGAPVANDLLEETLILLLRSLPTDHVTTILDTSHTDVGEILQGNLRVRSCPNPPAESPSPEELAFQEQILLRLNFSREQLKNSKSLNQTPGVILTAAGPSQTATEAQWNGFSAGLFTYALTQHLWQAAPATTVQISLSHAAGMVNQLVGKEHQPRLVGQKSLHQPLLAYYLPPDPSIGADGVVTAVEENGKTVQLWLAGLPATVLEYYSSNSLLSLSPSKPVTEELPVKTLNVEGSLENLQPPNPQPSTLEKPQLQIRSKEGLTARARIVSMTIADNYQLQVGQLVQEAVRVFPRNLSLTIALDAHLERIERVDATSAFANIPSVSSVVVAGEQPADYLFGKVPLPQPVAPEPTEVSSDSLSPRTDGIDSSVRTGGYGLFYLARDPIRDTVGEAGEAVKSAVNRLTPKLKTLLAAKLLRLTANEGSSRLGIRASLEMVTPQETLVMQRETLRAFSSLEQCPPLCNPSKEAGESIASRALGEKKNNRDLPPPVGEGSIPTLPIGSRIRYRLKNYSDRPLYFILLGLDSSGSAIAFYESQSFQEAQELEDKPPLKDAVIAPGETLTLPQSSASSDWLIPGPTGLAEIQLICSQAPFTKATMALEAARRPKGEGERIADLFNPLVVARAVLEDLHKASAMYMARTSSYAPESLGTVPDIYALDVNAWATLSFIYQVV
ncbi:MAG TPA: caspase family protein [Leptolyngbyaceae cyanobacterium]